MVDDNITLYLCQKPAEWLPNLGARPHLQLPDQHLPLREVPGPLRQPPPHLPDIHNISNSKGLLLLTYTQKHFNIIFSLYICVCVCIYIYGKRKLY